jgi:hypothetical protein
VLYRALLSVMMALVFCLCITPRAHGQSMLFDQTSPDATASPEILGAKEVITSLIRAGRKKDSNAWVECLTNDSAGTLSVVPLSVIALAVSPQKPDRTKSVRTDFEKMLDRYKIKDFIKQRRITSGVDKELTRRGRGILKSVYGFLERLYKDGLIPSDNKATLSAGLPPDAEVFTYRVIDSKRVAVLDPRSGQKSMEARLEDGKWRLQISRDAKWDQLPNSRKGK